MDYASHIIQNPEAWDNKDNRKKVYQVDIVFTKYPFYKKDWITHYDTLLKKRIRSIYELEPGIRNRNIQWNLILQTNCKNEEAAKHLFHGVVLWYREEIPMTKKIIIPKEQIASTNIDELMTGKYQFPDSTVFEVLARNSHWENMLIVNDWTASMYQYGTQAVLWHQSNLNKSKVSRFAFFNDGDRFKKIFKSKGIYFAEPENVQHVIQLMKRVQKNGDGGDTPENYIEALLEATSKTQSFNELILIADNKSPVKDIARLEELKVPVRIIVCGLKKGQTIRHDYLQIASSTSGSIHTIEEDIWNISEIKEGERVKIMDIEYQRTHGRIVKTKPKNLTAHL